MQLKTHIQLDNVDLDEENIGYEYPTKANKHMVCSGIFICATFFLGIMVGFALLKKIDTDLEQRISELERYNARNILEKTNQATSLRKAPESSNPMPQHRESEMEDTDNPNAGSPPGETYTFYDGPKHQEGKLLGIPKSIYQTYKDARLVPDYVAENFAEYAPGWKREVWDDGMVYDYFKEKGGKMLETYNQMHYKAHKADFWRYNILYDRGGVYMDIKCGLIQPLDELLILNNTLYTVIANNGVDIFNGIIASPPGNPIIKDQIDLMIKNPNEGFYRWYILQFGKRFRELLQYSEEQELMHTGYWENRFDSDWNFYFWREHCTKKAENCYDGLDRYGQCCYAFEGDTPEETDIQYFSENGHAWKIRYADYPDKLKWKEKLNEYG